MQEKKKSFKEGWEESKLSFRTEIKNKKRWLRCLIEVFFVFVLIVVDLLTKKYIYGACFDDLGNKIKIPLIEGVLSLTPVENTGASFGMLSGKTLYLTIVSVICSAFLLFFIFYSYKYRNLWLRSALVLITAGAIGNIVDRILLGYVRDFIYFELINFAVFNFADSCLTVGTIVLIVYILFFYSKEEAFLAKERNVKKEEIKSETPSLQVEDLTVKEESQSVTKEENSTDGEV